MQFVTFRKFFRESDMQDRIVVNANRHLDKVVMLDSIKRKGSPPGKHYLSVKIDKEIYSKFWVPTNTILADLFSTARWVAKSSVHLGNS